MSKTNRLQAQRLCANAPLFLPAQLKGGGAFVAVDYQGQTIPQDIPLVSIGKSKGGD